MSQVNWSQNNSCPELQWLCSGVAGPAINAISLIATFFLSLRSKNIITIKIYQSSFQKLYTTSLFCSGHGHIISHGNTDIRSQPKTCVTMIMMYIIESKIPIKMAMLL